MTLKKSDKDSKQPSDSNVSRPGINNPDSLGVDETPTLEDIAQKYGLDLSGLPILDQLEDYEMKALVRAVTEGIESMGEEKVRQFPGFVEGQIAQLVSMY